MQVIELKPIKEKYLSEMERIVKSTTVPNWSYEALSLLCGYKVINDAPVLDVKEPKHFDTESWKTTTTNLAPVTYALVKHGWWIDIQYPLAGHTFISCSECGGRLDIDSSYKSIINYCPNCGAKMDRKDNR